ncbi:cytochrome P450 4C1-like [Thrips palmi]|uniref:Cytochrome P450 4C1-like n=1 Tax=Thrips palmi TaxID=161013 RepID=A0A6P8ZMQ1_THRPL|nr:cytochrome P450 4C1-like [Thrips palmi]XP_034240994.1 cytochrome P450 4C1-like [Thrips palmi]
MDPVMLGLVLMALAFAANLFNRRLKWTKAVNLIPGPPAMPILGNSWDLLWTFKANQTQAFDFWTKTYGDIFRVWIGHNNAIVILSKPEDIEILLSSNKHIEKSRAYRQIETWIGQGLLTSRGQKWHSRRKMITPTFHFRILDQFVEVFNRNSHILVDKLLSTNGKTIPIHSFVALCTLDIICETAMGTNVDAQKNSTSSYVTAVNDATVSFHNRSMKPWLSREVMFNASADGKTFNAALKILHKYTREVIENRRRERDARRRSSLSVSEKDLGFKKRTAFLDQLLQAKDPEGIPLRDSDIQEEVDTFMFEGHDTTAAALSFIFYNVAANPKVQESLVEEMDQIFGDSDRAATSQDLQTMKYTERVIKETLRMYPSVPLFARAIKEDLPVTGGYVIPAGSNVTISCFQMGRNPDVWPEPEKFDPDRFLPENTARRHPYAYVPFSAGPRNCIGQKFAMLEMKSTVSRVIRRCTLSLPSPGYKLEVQGRLILKSTDGVLLKVSPRTTQS